MRAPGGQRAQELTPGKPGLPGWILPALAALIVFAGTVTHRFVWDDRHIIQHTRQVVRDRGPAALALVTFTERPGERPESSGYFRPVSLVSMWVNDPVGEASPLPYHLVNVLLHVVNSVLVFFFLRLVIPGGHGALAGSVLFAVHPVHAESVAWVSGRTDLLAALFLLSAVVLWFGHAGGAGIRKLWPHAVGMAAFAMACLAKETSFLLPGVALLWVLLAGRRSQGGTTDTPAVGDIRWIPGWFAVLGIVLLVRSSFLGIGVGPGWSTQNLWSWSGAIDLAGTVAGNLLTYLRFLLLPWPLAVYYPPGQPGVTATTVVAAAAFLALCLGLSGRRHRRMGLLGLVWTLGFLAPVSGVANLGLSAVAERFCYIPSIGLALVAGYAMHLLASRITLKAAVAAAAGALVVILGLGSILHSRQWRDEVTLFTSAVESSPVKVPNMYFNLGNALREAGELGRAVGAYEEAIRLHPPYLDALLNLASTHIGLGEQERALEVLARAQELAPDDTRPWSNRGIALEVLGRDEEALEAYTRAGGMVGGEAVASHHRANLLYRLGRYRESADAYRDVLSHEPDHGGALLGLARSLEELNLLDGAREAYLRAMERQQTEVAPYQGLGRVLIKQGRGREAAVVYLLALETESRDPGLHRGLTLAYHISGKDAEAREHIGKLQGTDPDLARQLADFLEDLASSRAGGGGLPSSPD